MWVVIPVLKSVIRDSSTRPSPKGVYYMFVVLLFSLI